jgi:regulator of nucleoside diphosphate kinase
MKEPFIYLYPEVTRENAFQIVRWLQDKEVIKYLSDTPDVSLQIRQVVERVSLPIVTHLFSSGGRFYIIQDKKGTPVGFVRLKVCAAETEMVIVIGDRENWGKRIGTSAIRESMKIAFFELRSRKMTARIHHENKRSLRAFLRAGFQVRHETPALIRLEITMEEYLNCILKGGNAMQAQVIITELDQTRLKKLIYNEAHQGTCMDQTILDLEQEINRAQVVNSLKVPREVITMNSRVLLDLGDDELEVSLVYPPEADLASNRLSVLSPIGTAILGYKEGDFIQWKIPSGVAQIHVKKVIYQPEAAGDYHL